MKKALKILLIVVACFIGLFGLIIFTLDMMFSDLCGNEIFKEALAPGGRFKAVIFQRDCGATTGFSTQISLLASDKDLPNEGGNIFIAKGHPDDRNIEIVWLSPRELMLRNTDDTEPLKKETTRKGIKVLYE